MYFNQTQLVPSILSSAHVAAFLKAAADPNLHKPSPLSVKRPSLNSCHLPATVLGTWGTEMSKTYSSFQQLVQPFAPQPYSVPE